MIMNECTLMYVRARAVLAVACTEIVSVCDVCELCVHAIADDSAARIKETPKRIQRMQKQNKLQAMQSKGCLEAAHRHLAEPPTHGAHSE